ncbi:MAG: WYL domain-containing protein [Selenomonadaceae bacterium]|nr:WYL domain-containing protein [Selenomonadaceae bacterium]
MQSLFDDTKNSLFRLLCQIVNEISAGGKFTRKEILRRIFALPEFIYLEAPEKVREEEIVDALFNFDSNGFAVVPTEKKFSLPISDTECSWLRAVLADEETAFLLPAAFRKKLLACLANCPPLYEKSLWRKLRSEQNSAARKNFFVNLSIIVEALRRRRKIFIDGQSVSPCRLEYDLSADKYFLIAWREEARTIKKMPVEGFDTVELSGEQIPDDTDERLENFYSAHVAEVSLEVQNTRNAVERCFALFSSFDKKARLQDDGTCLLTISYSPLDEEEIFEKILSLGATVTITAPENIRERIRQRFIEINALYE